MTEGAKTQAGSDSVGRRSQRAYEVGVLKALLSGQSPATEYQPLDSTMQLVTTA
jgi:hypothetical protein